MTFCTNSAFDGWTYTWQAGRQLAGMNRDGATLSFKYDHNALRTQKIVQTDWLPETTNYFLHGKLITHMTVDYTDFDEVAHTDKLHFFYDAQSRPAQLNFNGIIYTYIHNLQGDIVGILDSTGALVVEYKYDAWGKPISTTGNLAETLGKRNPFRYRGYVYDEETGLYYLRSRYYNPEIGRFINADNTDIIANNNDLFTCNLYAYCEANPIVGYDPDGTFNWKKTLAVGLAFVGAGLMLLAAASTGGASLLIGSVLISEATIHAAGTAALVTGATTTVASLLYASQNKYEGKTTYNKNGTQVHYEYNGNQSGNVHIHDKKSKTVIWRIKDAVEEYLKVSRTIERTLETPGVSEAVKRAIRTVRILSGGK